MSQTSPIIVHHLDNSRSQRILWLLEELEIPYEVKTYKRTPQMFAPKELLDVHPLGKSPVITDGDVTLAESGAIVEYLVEKYGASKVIVKESGRVDNLFFTHYAEGSVQPLLIRRLIFNALPAHVTKHQAVLKEVLQRADQMVNSPDLERHGKLIEAQLENTKGWFAGGDVPTSADYMMLFTLENFVDCAPEYCGPNIVEYVKRVQARPAYKRAIERGGEYRFLLM